MNLSQFDVLIVGAGAAGTTAAIGLARAGFAVALVEAAAFPGAENWSGCVYFAENLADPDIVGSDGVESLPWERQLVERGFFATDGHGLLGATYRDPEAFRHCYTVLRPIYDRHLGQIAQQHGVTLYAATTAESLIRAEGRVIGVATNRGPLYADLVFLAEGDAAHLVAREGYERSIDARVKPAFLLGVKQVIELPPGAIEERFGVGEADGVAYDLLLRNGTLNGRALHLNMRGFVYANRQSLSIGLVLPAANLARHFAGDPNLLLEWFLDLPALRPWLRDGRRGVFGAKLLRVGVKDVPILIDDGLAIGGAASALGVDFLYPNFIGPATASGLLFVRAAQALRAGGEDFTRTALERHYLEPLRQTHYWQDAEYLRFWPEYVRRTQVLFGLNLDLVLRSAHVWTRPRWWFGKLRGWLRLLNDEMNLLRWARLRADGRRLSRALRLRASIGWPALWRMLLAGYLNALRDLVGQPRAHVPEAGTLRFHFRAGDDSRAVPPAWLRRWFRRFHPVLTAAARTIYRNDNTPLAVKLPEALGLLTRQINLLDLLIAAGFGLMAAVAHTVGRAWQALRRRAGRPESLRRGPALEYATAARQASDLTDAAARSAPALAERLATLGHDSAEQSQVRVLWPLSLAGGNAVLEAGLWHVCPTGVFEAHVGLQERLRIVVNSQRCIQCEVCWRTSDLVDWGRAGVRRFVYPVHSPVAPRVLAAATPVQPLAPRRQDVWEQCRSVTDVPLEAFRLLSVLESSLMRFETSLTAEPRTVSKDRAEYLEMLAQHAQQVARRLAEVLTSAGVRRPDESWQFVCRLADELAVKATERARRTWDGRFAWTAADGRQLRQHHLAGLRQLLGRLPEDPAPTTWLAAEAVDDTAERPEAERLANRLCRRVVEYAVRRVRFAGCFHDEEARDSVGKFGAVKRRVAVCAARRHVIETLTHNDCTPAVSRAALFSECLDAMIDDTEQVCGGPDDFEVGVGKPPSLDQGNWQQLGADLLRAWLPDGSLLAKPNDGGLLPELHQRQALQAECTEIERLRARLTALINLWQSGRQAVEKIDGEIAEQVARLDAYQYAALALLLRTHARLEHGLTVAIDVPLLRVWLEETANALDEFIAVVQTALEPVDRPYDRPLVDPGAPPLVSSFADYLASPLTYQSGDFLCTPVDLSRPRTVPEMVPTATQEARTLPVKSQTAWRRWHPEEAEFLGDALFCEQFGREAHPGTKSAHLETACIRLLVTGASDLQRFLILRALACEVAPRWAETPPRPPLHLAREALELEALKATFRARCDAALAFFGQSLWQNPNLQANVFALPEAAAWLQAAESVLGRMAWLSRHGRPDDEPGPRHPAGARALAHAFREIRSRLQRFDGDLAQLRRGHYAPHVRAATLLFANHDRSTSTSERNLLAE